jgi:DNA-binding Lrp family transcriptional regulator
MDMSVARSATGLTPFQHALLAAIEGGLPLVARPYAQLAAQLGTTEAAVIHALRELLDDGVIKRFGVVVRHRELGYRANAMVVWNLPDDSVDAVGRRLGADPAVHLCYRRPRRLPEWPYNLFTMLHGRDRDAVSAEVTRLAARHALAEVPHAVLFSRRGFKQCGARYAAAPARDGANRPTPRLECASP